MSTSKYLTDDMIKESIEFRRDLHRNPELGFLEMRTASKVHEVLSELGLSMQLGEQIMNKESIMGFPSKKEIRDHYEELIHNDELKILDDFKNGYTAILATINTGKDGPITLLRVDMDALPIIEKKDGHFPSESGFASNTFGVMHACGHDVHTTVGVYAAKLIESIKSQLAGQIKILFQPAEEGVRGAKSIVDSGVIKDIDYFIASHIGLERNSGELLISDNGFLASTKLDIEIKGLSSHAGGNPEDGKNALLAACQLVTQIYSISRTSKGSTRVNVGKLTAGNGRNIIADTALLEVETRGSTTEANQYVEAQVRNLTKGIELAYGVKTEIKQVGAGITAKGSEELRDTLYELGKREYGEKNVWLESNKPSGSEDATFIMNEVQQQGGQAVYMNYGSTLPAPHHNPAFDVDEKDMIKYIDFVVDIVKELNKKEA